jgi:hypothetical protein
MAKMLVLLCDVYFNLNIRWELDTQWLTPVILTTWESEIAKIEVRGQPEQIVHETPSPKQEQNRLEAWYSQ